MGKAGRLGRWEAGVVVKVVEGIGSYDDQAERISGQADKGDKGTRPVRAFGGSLCVGRRCGVGPGGSFCPHAVPLRRDEDGLETRRDAMMRTNRQRKGDGDGDGEGEGDGRGRGR
jgi:hypothetical protein